MFGGRKSVVDIVIHPHVKLHKNHTALSFHIFHEVIEYNMVSEMIQDSLWKKSYILLDYIYFRTRLNQFEMFVSSLIHERTLKTVLL